MKDNIQKIREKFPKVRNFEVLGYKTNISFGSDFTLNPLFYPLYVVVVNRIVSSPISRAKNTIPFVSTFKNLSVCLKIGGFRCLYLGFGASIL